jgi:uncharacterized protein (DUF1330 family)
MPSAGIYELQHFVLGANQRLFAWRPFSGAHLTTGSTVMKTQYTVALAIFAGFGLGAVAVQGLHAQVKPKAYTVTEIEVLDQAALATYIASVTPTIKAAGGRNFNTAGGKIIAFTGQPPKRVAIIEWDSPQQAQTYLDSTAWKNLAPQRDKAEKITRSYVVEAVAN